MQLQSTGTGKIYHVRQALPALGEGVYRGFADGRQDVLVRLAPEGAAAAALAAEVALLERFRCPEIARPIDRGSSGGYDFVVFESVAEQPLAALISEADLAPLAALDLLVQVFDIVLKLHQSGIAWGRLRPQAFTINKSGRLRLVSLRGAGVPFSDAATIGQLDATYMAPELSDGTPPTQASDRYAWGVLAYDVLYGTVPFAGATVPEVIVKHLSEPLPDLRGLRPELPDELVQLIAQTLAKQPADRLASSEQISDRLHAIYDRLFEEERARMVTCPRCQAQVLPAGRCPLCGAPFNVAEPAVVRQRIGFVSLVAIAVVGLTLVIFLFGLGGSDEPTLVEAEAAPQASAVVEEVRAVEAPTRLVPTVERVVESAAKAPVEAANTVEVPGGDIADPDVDLIAARVALEDDELLAEISVVGQFAASDTPRSYQVLLDTDGATGGDSGAPWSDLRADYSLFYRSGDAEAMLMRWDGKSWQGVAAVGTEVSGGTLRLRMPTDWLALGEELRYGVVSLNRRANLSDYAPARTGAALVVERP